MGTVHTGAACTGEVRPDMPIKSRMIENMILGVDTHPPPPKSTVGCYYVDLSLHDPWTYNFVFAI